MTEAVNSIFHRVPRPALPQSQGTQDYDAYTTYTPAPSYDMIATRTESVNTVLEPVPATLREDLPLPKTGPGEYILQACQKTLRDMKLQRLWEEPSLMVGGVTYWKVTEHVTISDSTRYTFIVEELQKPVGVPGLLTHPQQFL